MKKYVINLVNSFSCFYSMLVCRSNNNWILTNILPVPHTNKIDFLLIFEKVE